MIYYPDALNAIIDDGIEAARLDYQQPSQKQKLDGSIAGFEACRNQSPVQIAILLAQARARAQEALHAPDYQYWRCREAEIEWVANVLSVLLWQKNLPGIVQPTVRGLLKAMDIVGVKKSGKTTP